MYNELKIVEAGIFARCISKTAKLLFVFNLIHSVYQIQVTFTSIRRGGLMVSALDSGSNGPGLSPGRGHCVVFLSKTLYSHSASLHPGV